MKCEIIAVGTELLMGQIVNTNAAELAVELSGLGVGIYYQTVVGDNPGRLEEVFRTALNRSELIVLCGGLGPTDDDLTRETVASVLGLPLEKNEEWEARLEDFFRKLNRKMSRFNRRQAMVPMGGILMANDRGTAPGLLLDLDNMKKVEADWDRKPESSRQAKIIIMVPGPPKEMLPMFRRHAVPYLQETLKESGELGLLQSKILRVIGLGESEIAEKIDHILRKQTNPTIAPLVNGYEVHLRITALSKSKEDADRLINETAEEIKDVLGDHIYGEDNEDLGIAVAKMLWEKNLTVSVAESCTGGYLSHRLTNIPDSSRYFKAGLVTYSNEAKAALLGVDPATLEAHGAVSEEVALQMAAGARKAGGSDIAVGITGIAGPTGGTEEKPVGLTYISLETEEGSSCRRNTFWGNRFEIKEKASQSALYMMWNYLKKK